MERRRLEAKHSAAEDARREKDVLIRGLAKAGDKGREAMELVELQEAIKRNLGAEVASYAGVMKGIREQIEALQEQRAQYVAQQEEAQTAYLAALEGVKLQELQMAALQKKIEEGTGKLKQQQSLYDAVRADRNLYSKNLAEATQEITDMKRAYKQLSRSTESLKSDIESKDVGLIKEHYEHHRVEKEKETLRNELTRIQKQVQSCEQILTSQETEVAKLNAIITEADAEKTRQQKEYEAVVAERNLLQGQLVKRDSELSALYEKLRVQKSSLANGAASYARVASERDELASRAAVLKGELLVAETQTSDAGALEAEAKRLETDLLAEKTKIRALTEELETPINIHRWRAMADRDPERWALIQRIQSLQKRVLESRDLIRVKEAAIADKEKEYSKLKDVLARQPSPEIADAISSYQSMLKAKTKQLRALESELDAYRGRVDEYKREMARVSESIEALNVDYVRRMKAARKASATAGQAQGGAAAGIDEAALLDVTAEMTAAGFTADSAGQPPRGAKFIPGVVEAVKDEADALLAAYADVLASGSHVAAAEGGEDYGDGAAT